MKPRPFPERYAAALADPNIPEGLLAFQRSWREARDVQIGELERLTGEIVATLGRIEQALDRR